MPDSLRAKCELAFIIVFTLDTNKPPTSRTPRGWPVDIVAATSVGTTCGHVGERVSDRMATISFLLSSTKCRCMVDNSELQYFEQISVLELLIQIFRTPYSER